MWKLLHGATLREWTACAESTAGVYRLLRHTDYYSHPMHRKAEGPKYSSARKERRLTWTPFQETRAIVYFFVQMSL